VPLDLRLTHTPPMAGPAYGMRQVVPALLLSEVNDEGVAQLSIEQLLGSPLVDPRRHLDRERVQRYAQMLDELPPIAVFSLEDQTLLLARTSASQWVPARSSGSATRRAITAISTRDIAVDGGDHRHHGTVPDNRGLPGG
jgi:hypothetical protein